MFYCTTVYPLDLKQPSAIYLVVNHCKVDVQVTLDITVTLILVPVELSTSISGSHDATHVVNVYVSQTHVYLR